MCIRDSFGVNMDISAPTAVGAEEIAVDLVAEGSVSETDGKVVFTYPKIGGSLTTEGQTMSLYFKLDADSAPIDSPYVISRETKELFKTVSYTHLDVYKRQGLWRRKKRFAAGCLAAR